MTVGISIFVYLEIYLQGKLLEERFLEQKVNTYLVLLDIDKLPPPGFTSAFPPTMYENAGFFTAMSQEYVIKFLMLFNMRDENWYLKIGLMCTCFHYEHYEWD